MLASSGTYKMSVSLELTLELKLARHAVKSEDDVVFLM